MRCYIQSDALKGFARSIAIAVKLSEEVYFDCRKDELLVKAINPERSVFYSACFPRTYFQQFECNENVLCSLNCKCVNIPFRSPANLEKKQASCWFQLESNSDYLILEIESNSGQFNTYELPMTNTVFYNVPFLNDLPDYFSINVYNFNKQLAEFPRTAEYVSMRVNRTSVRFESYSFNEHVRNTSYELSANDFDNFTILSDQEIFITFCFKSVRNFLSSIETKQSECRIFLDENTKPIYLQVKTLNFEARLVVSSLNVANGSVSGNLEESLGRSLWQSTTRVVNESSVEERSSTVQRRSQSAIQTKGAREEKEDEARNGTSQLSAPVIPASHVNVSQPTNLQPINGNIESSTVEELTTTGLDYDNLDDEFDVELDDPDSEAPGLNFGRVQTTPKESSQAQSSTDQVTESVVSQQGQQNQRDLSSKFNSCVNGRSQSKDKSTADDDDDDLMDDSTPNVPMEVYEQMTATEKGQSQLHTNSSRQEHFDQNLDEKVLASLNENFSDDDEDELNSHQIDNFAHANPLPGQPDSFQIYQDTQESSANRTLTQSTRASLPTHPPPPPPPPATSHSFPKMSLREAIQRGPVLASDSDEDQDDELLYDLERFKKSLTNIRAILP